MKLPAENNIAFGLLCVKVFFSKFLMGEASKFSVPVGPRRGRSRMGGGGTCEKNPTEAKTAHLMQN